jgi:hypothetical protein
MIPAERTVHQQAAAEADGLNESRIAMQERYTFRRIEREEVPIMFSMILERMKWMDAKGIQAWNATDYDKAYPQSFYELARQRNEVFVVADSRTAEIVSAAVLREQDDSWQDDSPALYLHSFVSRIGSPNAGDLLLRFAEEYAAGSGKRYLRLDSAESNETLAAYYAKRGFVPAGKCEDGPYRGILRQKALFQSISDDRKEEKL